jgi:hypothetical protein
MVRQGVSTAEGVPVYPIAMYVPIDTKMDPADAFVQRIRRLHDPAALVDAGTGKPMGRWPGIRGIERDSNQGTENLAYLFLVGCSGEGVWQLVVLRTPRDTSEQVEPDFREIARSLRPSAAPDHVSPLARNGTQ